MGNLLDFYKQHRRLFLAQKHQNLSETERRKDSMLQDFFSYCEDMRIFHTKGINKKVVSSFFQSENMKGRSEETRRKYFLVLREFFKRFYDKELNKNEVGIR